MTGRPHHFVGSPDKIIRLAREIREGRGVASLERYVATDSGVAPATMRGSAAILDFADRLVWLHQDVSGLAPGTPILDPKGALP